jgi:threonine dehydrogenase-like Zn-dependent dehydrogenase
VKALCWHGVHDVRLDRVPDPTILDPRDAIVRVTATAIRGSDLHLDDGYVPTMSQGDILGHEFMGEVVEVGPDVRRLRVGDRVVVPFPIACGACFFCGDGMFSVCENSNPNAHLAERLCGRSPAGLFGYSHALGGYAGGQAEYVRVPFADVGPVKVPDGLDDDKVLFLSDILPTGAYDKAKPWTRLQTDRPGALRVAIMACRNGGTVSVPGVYGGEADKFPLGALMNRSITLRTGQTHVHRYLGPLHERIESGEIDPSFVITHRLPLEAGPDAYRMCRDKQDGCVKVVLRP